LFPNQKIYIKVYKFLRIYVELTCLVVAIAP